MGAVQGRKLCGKFQFLVGPRRAVGAVQIGKLYGKFQFAGQPEPRKANAVVLLQKYVRTSEAAVNAEKTVLRQEMFGTGQNVSTMI